MKDQRNQTNLEKILRKFIKEVEKIDFFIGF